MELITSSCYIPVALLDGVRQPNEASAVPADHLDFWVAHVGTVLLQVAVEGHPDHQPLQHIVLQLRS